GDDEWCSYGPASTPGVPPGWATSDVRVRCSRRARVQSLSLGRAAVKLADEGGGRWTRMVFAAEQGAARCLSDTPPHRGSHGWTGTFSVGRSAGADQALAAAPNVLDRQPAEAQQQSVVLASWPRPAI